MPVEKNRKDGESRHIKVVPAHLVIRRLESGDAALYQAFRLHALQESPLSFGSSFEEEKDKPIHAIATSLEKDGITGAFIDGALIGTAGYFTSPLQKLAHKAHIFGIYVRPEWRNKGVMHLLLQQLIAFASEKHTVALASVLGGNEKALNCFLKSGFQIYATEKKAMLKNGIYYDLVLVRLDIEGPVP